MAKTFLVVVAVLGFSWMSVLAQSKSSIQGVWRPIEVTVTNPNPGPAALPKGTHTAIQPGLLIFTGKHYSQILDTAAKPRPIEPFKTPGKATLEELQTRWGPFQANSGSYEVSGSTLTLRQMVAKNPAIQGGKNFTRYTIQLDGNNLWTTPVENASGKVENPATVKYVRVE
jgi:hypothetical protein